MCDYCKDSDYGHDRSERIQLRLERLMDDWQRYRMQKWTVSSVIDSIQSVIHCDDQMDEIRERYQAELREAREEALTHVSEGDEGGTRVVGRQNLTHASW